MTNGSDPALPAPGAKFSIRDGLILLLAPILAWWILRINLFVQLGYVDPWFYTGSGQAFEKLVECYGWAYYYIRFPVTFVMRVFCMGGAPEVGYVLLRFLLVVGSGGLLYAMALRQYGRSAAVAGYLFLFCNPLFLRVLIWDLTPFLSVPLALGGAALWLYDERPAYWRNAVAGALFCASVNSHIFTTTAIACVMVGVLGAHLILRRPLGRLAWQLLAGATGFVLMWLAGWGYYQYLVGGVHPLMFLKENLIAMKAGSNYALVNARPFSVWATQQTYFYVPFLWLGALLLLWRRPGRAPAGYAQWTIAIAAAAYATFYLVYRFGMGRFVIEEFYYFGHIWAVFPLVVPVVVSRLSDRPAWLWGMVAVFVVLMVGGDYALTGENQTRLNWLGHLYNINRSVMIALGLAAAGIAGMRWLAGRPAAQAVSFAIFCAAMQTLSLVPDSSREVYAVRTESVQWDHYRAAVDLARIWKKYGSRDNVPHLWYRNAGTDYSIASISCVVLGYTLHDKWGGGPGMPGLGAYEMQRLTDVPERCVFLMDRDRAEIERGKQALEAAGMKLRTVEQTTIAQRSLVVYVEVVQVAKAVAP